MCCGGSNPSPKPMQATQNMVQRPVARVPLNNGTKSYEPNSMVIPQKVKDDLIRGQQLAHLPKRGANG